jgi:hypothetical protein
MRLAGRKGSALLETVVAVLIMSTAGIALIVMIQKAMLVSVKSREQQTCARMAQTAFARLKNVDFYFLFAADSAQANYGLQAAYPYMAVLNGLRTTLQSSKFDRFRVQVTFMRRDTSDVNGDGRTSDLIAFTDEGGDLVDDYDSSIRYFDQNLDGDFFDTYTAGGRTISEQPDTHIKRVTIDVFRGGDAACSQTELVSLEQFGGDYNPSSEAVLALLVSTPTNNSFLYKADTPGLQSSRSLVIAKSYPPEIGQFRADTVSALVLSGETDPLADVHFYVNDSGELWNVTADSLGQFSAASLAVTTALSEGVDVIRSQATKASYTSPITARGVIYDVSPPSASSATPTGTVNTLAPFVAITLTDPGFSTTTTSGICPDVISLRVNGVSVAYDYNAASGQLVWVDSVTGTVPLLSSGTYTAVAEAGDYAGYKTTASWTFTLSVPSTDNSAPAVANKSPIGAAASQLPVISVRAFDNQSGIIPSSIVLRLDGAVVVSAANIGPSYDAASGVVSYTPPGAFAAGSAHTVEITASHGASDPPDKVTSVDTWGFSVP